MTPAARYLFDRGYPFIDPISAERARQIFERAKDDPDSGLRGTLEEGFSYVVARSGNVELVRAGVRPQKEPEPLDDPRR